MLKARRCGQSATLPVVIAAFGAAIQMKQLAMAAAHEARDPLRLGLRQVDLFRPTTLPCVHGGFLSRDRPTGTPVVVSRPPA
jgi:hypothetical protein